MTNTETAAQLDLDKLEALARAATPGPWHSIEHSWDHTGIYAEEEHIAALDISEDATEENQGELEAHMAANAAFMTAANPAAILALIAQARAQPAAAPIAPSVNSGEGALSDTVLQVHYWMNRADAAEQAFVHAKFDIEKLEAQLAQQRQAAPHAQAAPVYQVDAGNGWRDVQKFDYDLYVEHSDGSIKTRIVYAAPAPQEAEQASASPAGVDDGRDAARWREVLMHVGGTYCDGGARFTLRWLSIIPGVDIMKGSVASHFTAAIDAARAARIPPTTTKG